MKLRITALVAAVAFVIAAASAVYYASWSPAKGAKGKEVPDFQFQDGAGRTYSLAEFPGRVAIDWGVYGVPETFVIDRDGRIVYKHIGAVTPNLKTRCGR